jgi:hypothetical protein
VPQLNDLRVQLGKNFTPVEHPEGTRFNGASGVKVLDSEFRVCPDQYTNS